MLDNKIANMSPGEALLDVPIGEMIQKLAASIAEAQLKLDLVAIKVASILSEEKVTFKKDDGTESTKSLLELGFLPTFYQFTETTIEVKMTISMKIEESLTLGLDASLGDSSGDTEDGAAKPAAGQGDKRVTPWGVAISADYHRKYEFDMSGSSTVSTKLVSVPPPPVFLETIKEHARAGGGALDS